MNNELAIIRRLKKAARTNEKLAARMKEAGAKHAESYACGSAFGFHHAVTIIKEYDKTTK